MSKLTSFTSASDALIQPTGATNGQTLTWNATNGQFEPTTPAPPAGNSITSAMILNGTIQALDIADQVITGNKIAAGTITFDNIADGTIISSKLQNGGITADKMGVNSVASSNIIDGTIQNEDIGVGQIGLDKLAPIPTTSLVGLGVSGSPSSPTNITLGTNLSFSGNVLNAGGTNLPTFTNLNGLRGDGTNIPVVDNRLKYAASGNLALELVGDNAKYLGVANSGSSMQLSVVNVTTPTVGASFSIAAQSAAGTNQDGGNISLFAGSATGTQGSNIQFYTAATGGTSGTAASASGLTWTMGRDAIGSTLTGNNTLFNTITTAGNGGLRIGSANGGNTSLECFGSGNLNINTNAGNIDISPFGAGGVTLGGNGTGVISVGTNSKTTTLNGIVKRPGLSVFKAQRATSTQAIPANTQTTVIFNASSLLGTSTPAITLNTTTGVMTFTRTGTFRISGSLAVQSATANARVGIAFVPGTAVCTATNVEGDILGAANLPKGMRFEYEFTCTTAGTFSIQIGSTAALTLGFNQGTIFTATKTNCIIEERG